MKAWPHVFTFVCLFDLGVNRVVFVMDSFLRIP